MCCSREAGGVAACNRFVSHFICHNFRLIFMSIIKLRWWAKLHSERCMKGAATSETPRAHKMLYIQYICIRLEQAALAIPKRHERRCEQPIKCKGQLSQDQINLRSFAPLYSSINSMRKAPQKKRKKKQNAPFEFLNFLPAPSCNKNVTELANSVINLQINLTLSRDFSFPAQLRS